MGSTLTVKLNRRSKKKTIKYAFVSGFVLFVVGVFLGYLTWGMPSTSDVPSTSKAVLYVAPYSATTHPCFTHNKAGCKAEYPNTQFKYKVVIPKNEKTEAKLVMEGTTSTDKNGFFELVLDAGSIYWLTVEGVEGISNVPISTHPGYADCITYTHLQPSE